MHSQLYSRYRIFPICTLVDIISRSRRTYYGYVSNMWTFLENVFIVFIPRTFQPTLYYYKIHSKKMERDICN